MRNHIFILLSVPVFLCLSISCKKDVTVSGSSSLTILNAMLDVDTLVLDINNSSSKFNNSGPRIIYNNFQYSGASQFSAPGGTRAIALYPLSDKSFLHSPLFELSIDLPESSIRSLFLAGTIAAPDTLLTTDILKHHALSDSSTSIRFINLLSGNTPISVNMLGKPIGSLINHLGYKGVTGFNSFAATQDVNSITFEFRDANSGILLTSYTAFGINAGDAFDPVNTWRFRNNTLALLGAPGTTGSKEPKVLLINHY